MSGHIEITDNMRILFQGDSITDAGRGQSATGLGNGYVGIASGLMGALFPEKRLELVNRGISGNRVVNLVDRWQRDCIDIKPDLVSIMIGVNDTWRRYDSDDPTSVEDYEKNYRVILERTRDEVDAKIVVIEPFVMPVPEDRVKWREDIDPKIDAARRLARELADIYVPMDGLFAAACVDAPPEYWAPDGVHPTSAGHGFIALNWVRHVTGMLK